MTETPNEYDDLLDIADHPGRKRIIGLLVLAMLVILLSNVPPSLARPWCSIRACSAARSACWRE
jgi:hypothetical protein